MKKYRTHKNVILFPQLEQRLLKKGNALLQEGRLHEAIEIFQQAREMMPENPELLYALTNAYLQLRHFSEAEEIVEMMLRQGIGDYFTTIELYISILFQQKNYHAVEQLVSMLLEEHQVPFNKIDQYRDLLELCRKLKGEEKDGELEVTLQNRELPEQLFSGDLNKIIQNITMLTQEDIPYYIDTIQEYLQDDEANFFVKTALLNVLFENNYNEMLMVEKFGKTVNIVLTDYYPPQEAPFTLAVKEYIETKLEHVNPTLMNYAFILADRFFFNIYPLEKNFTNPERWGESIIAVVQSYVEGTSPQTIMDELDEIKEAVGFILEVEEKFNLPIE